MSSQDFLTPNGFHLIMYSNSSQVALYSLARTCPDRVDLNSLSHLLSPDDQLAGAKYANTVCTSSRLRSNSRREPFLVCPDIWSVNGLYFTPRNVNSFNQTPPSFIIELLSGCTNIPLSGSFCIDIGLFEKKIPSSA